MAIPLTHPRYREYSSPLVADKRRNTADRRRQVTKLSKPSSQYSPLNAERVVAISYPLQVMAARQAKPGFRLKSYRSYLDWH
jgi:hypothetical protein